MRNQSRSSLLTILAIALCCSAGGCAHKRILHEDISVDYVFRSTRLFLEPASVSESRIDSIHFVAKRLADDQWITTSVSIRFEDDSIKPIRISVWPNRLYGVHGAACWSKLRLWATFRRYRPRNVA